jgi:hypothetical protein
VSADEPRLHHADIGAFLKLPGVGRLALHRSLHAAGDQQDWKQQVISVTINGTMLA